MAGPPLLSTGEIGGIFAGVVALLVAVGRGMRWLLGWRERRTESLYQKNLRWEDRLQSREDAFEAEQRSHFLRIEARLARAEAVLEAVLNAYHLIAGELRGIDPANLKLGMADELLKAAFRLDAAVPGEMTAILDKLQ